MTKKEAIDLLDNLIGFIEDNHGSDYDEALKIAIKALEQEPSTDAVSKNDVIKMLNTMDRYVADKLRLCDTNKEFPSNEVFIVDDVYEGLDLLPPVTPTRAEIKSKTGHWIGIDEEPHEDYECDKCGYVVSTFTANIEPHTEYKFCPNCGARMVEPQESEDKEMSKANKTYCTECPYFSDVIYEGEQWFGARCKKDGHSTMPSMYAIKSLYDSCPLTTESEMQE